MHICPLIIAVSPPQAERRRREKMELKKSFKTESILYDNLQFLIDDQIPDYPDIEDRVKKDKTLSLYELIQEYDKVSSSTCHDEKEKDIELAILKILIAKKLELVQDDHMHHLLYMLQEAFEMMEDYMDELKKFKNHRHKTMFGLYTEKAVY